MNHSMSWQVANTWLLKVSMTTQVSSTNTSQWQNQMMWQTISVIHSKESLLVKNTRETSHTRQSRINRRFSPTSSFMTCCCCRHFTSFEETRKRIKDVFLSSCRLLFFPSSNINVRDDDAWFGHQIIVLDSKSMKKSLRLSRKMRREDWREEWCDWRSILLLVPCISWFTAMESRIRV